MQLPTYRKNAIIFFLLKWQYFILVINEVHAFSFNLDHTRSKMKRFYRKIEYRIFSDQELGILQHNFRFSILTAH